MKISIANKIVTFYKIATIATDTLFIITISPDLLENDKAFNKYCQCSGEFVVKVILLKVKLAIK